MTVIIDSDLQTYLHSAPVDESMSQIVDLTNALVEAVTGVVSPPSPDAVAVALEVAARAYRGTYGNVRLGSLSISGTASPEQVGVYLNDAERRRLLGVPVMDAIPWSGSMPYLR